MLNSDGQLCQPLTNVHALHVVVEGDAVGDTGGACGPPGLGDVEEGGEQASFVSRNPWPRCLNVHVITCRDIEGESGTNTTFCSQSTPDLYKRLLVNNQQATFLENMDF